ncbi:FtsX-like permease family protein [Lacinutrix sp. MedPE-SW]|uniref:ABC transporter permease n=1 Tax=Lacinutrix sp. MedPE-SW TaxID=1860087 RepID=UPI00091F03BD|nr:FtsX-like permease family protein [Lacinutrix sp. MedPE-SW]OIQ23446.1 MAG: ABC transporter permease [Lacinutrix sp. MedPE-SW]
MSFSYYIAKRYLRSKSSNNAINFITYIAIGGIILGAASLFIVLSGFSGLRDFTLEFTTIIDPDLKAETTIGKSFLLSASDEEKLKAIDGIASYSKIVEERVIGSFDGAKQAFYIKGVDEKYQIVNAVDSIIEYGSWLTKKTNQVVVGYGVSSNLNLGVLNYGKRLYLGVPKPGKGQINSINEAFNQVETVCVGIFAVNEKLDASHIFSSIELAQELLGYKPNQLSSLEFRLKDNADEKIISSQIQDILGNAITVKNKTQLNDSLNKMLNTENLAVYLIFTLILIIAFFNVVGSLIMMMLDKKKSLTTLFNIGATVKDIRKIFFLQGTLMSIVGGLIGLVVSIVLVMFQLYGPENMKVMITQSLAYPVAFRVENVFIVFVTITVLGIIASKIASVRITKAMVKTV